MLWSSSTGLAVTDRGLQFGDGVFETLLVVASDNNTGNAHVWLLDEHLQRLQHGCERLGICYPQQLLQTQLQMATSQVREGFAVLKLVVTAQGPSQGGARGYARDTIAQPNLHCSLHEAKLTPLQDAQPARLRVTKTTLATQPTLAGIKHLNRLEQVLARRELRAGDFEGLMLNSDQGVVECTSSNLFAVIDEQLCTPPLKLCGVAGVLRQHLLAEFGDRLQVQPISLEELRRAQEVFVTNSVYGVRAVGELIGQHWQEQYAQGPWFAQVRFLLQAQVEQLALIGSVKSGSVKSSSGKNDSGMMSSGASENV